ncbi:hypothetical protein VTG60DRAFT_5173 [Thermothelomyces hinnuleus]
MLAKYLRRGPVPVADWRQKLQSVPLLAFFASLLSRPSIGPQWRLGSPQIPVGGPRVHYELCNTHARLIRLIIFVESLPDPRAQVACVSKDEQSENPAETRPTQICLNDIRKQSHSARWLQVVLPRVLCADCACSCMLPRSSSAIQTYSKVTLQEIAGAKQRHGG